MLKLVSFGWRVVRHSSWRNRVYLDQTSAGVPSDNNEHEVHKANKCVKNCQTERTWKKEPFATEKLLVTKGGPIYRVTLVS